MLLTDLDLPRFFTTHDRNAVFPMSADTFWGLPDFPSVVRTSKNGSPLLSSPTLTTPVESFLLKYPETFSTSKMKKKRYIKLFVIFCAFYMIVDRFAE